MVSYINIMNNTFTRQNSELRTFSTALRRIIILWIYDCNIIFEPNKIKHSIKPTNEKITPELKLQTKQHKYIKQFISFLRLSIQKKNKHRHSLVYSLQVIYMLNFSIVFLHGQYNFDTDVVNDILMLMLKF